METETDIVVNVDVAGIIAELQTVQGQNSELLTEVQGLRVDNARLYNVVELQVLLTVVLVVYKIREQVLSWIKRGIRSDV